MKTAISLPDEVFQRADRLARTLRKSRSQLYAQALREFLIRHDPDEITAAMDRVCESLDTSLDPAFEQASRELLKNTEW